MAMHTKESICNNALVYLGAQSIQSFTEISRNAEVCRGQYDIIRQQVLRDFPWGFAETEKALNLLANESSVRYSYAYQYPVDCLQARYIYQTVKTTPIPFKKVSQSNGQQSMILTNKADAVLIYTREVTDTNAFDVSFTGAFSLRLATAMATAITKKKGKALELLSMYRDYLIDAETSDGQEVSDDPDEAVCSFIAARG